MGVRVCVSDRSSIPSGIHVCVYLRGLGLFEGIHRHGHVMYWCVTMSVHYSCMLHKYWRVTTQVHNCVCVVQMHTSVSLLYTCETRLYVYVSLWAAALSGWP